MNDKAQYEESKRRQELDHSYDPDNDPIIRALVWSMVNSEREGLDKPWKDIMKWHEDEASRRETETLNLTDSHEAMLYAFKNKEVFEEYIKECTREAMERVLDDLESAYYQNAGRLTDTPFVMKIAEIRQRYGREG